MNQQIAAGKWKQAKGKIQSTWGKLTDQELDEISGNTKSLIGKVQEKYGYSLEKARNEVSSFFEKMEKAEDDEQKRRMDGESIKPRFPK